MTREDYEEYIDHFNNKRYEEALKCFAEDVEVQYFAPFKKGAPEGEKINGKKALYKSYEQLHDTVREVIKLGKYVTDGKNVYVELWTEFHAFEDTPNFSAGPLKKGEDFFAINFFLYWINDEGKFNKMRVATHRICEPCEAFL